MDSSEVEVKRLYELIGRLFAEGRDMQALIHQLQSTLQNNQDAWDNQQGEINALARENNKLKTENHALEARVRTLVQLAPIPDGQK